MIPVRGGISLDLTRMDRIVEISPGDLTATVAGGRHPHCARARGRRARPLLPGRPGSGRDARRDGRDERGRDDDGALREDARERARARGGARRRSRRSATGSRAAKTSAGYDLLGLLVGSEGTLAVITELTRAAPRDPRARGRAADLVPRRRGARAGPPPAIVAAGGGVTAHRAARRAGRRGDQRLPGHGRIPEAPCLFVEATGSAEPSRPTSSSCTAIARGGGRARRSSTSATRRARPPLGGAARRPRTPWPRRRRARSERATDVCVPLSELAGAVAFARARARAARPRRRHRRARGRRQPPRRAEGRPRRRGELARSDELVAERSSTTRSRAAARAPASTASASARSARSSGSTAT